MLMFSSLNIFAQSVVSKEEYAVYAKILREIYKEELENRKENADKNKKIEFVILKQTNTFDIQSEQTNSESKEIEPHPQLQKAIDDFVKGLKESKTDKDYDLKNTRHSNLQKVFPVKFKYSLVSKEEIDVLIAIGNKEFTESQKNRKYPLPELYGGEGWKYFYEKYTNANGYYKFSRVGFNSKKTFAKVYIEAIGGSWNSSITYILKKKRGKWEIYTLFGSSGVS